MMRTMRSSFGLAAPSPRRGGRRLQRGDVDRLRALVAGLGIEGDLRALGQRLEAVGVDAGVVDEEVLATLIGRDEAEALVVVEPLHGSGRHDFSSMARVLRGPGGCGVAATTAGAEHSLRRARARHEREQRTGTVSRFARGFSISPGAAPTTLIRTPTAAW